MGLAVASIAFQAQAAGKIKAKVAGDSMTFSGSEVSITYSSETFLFLSGIEVMKGGRKVIGIGIGCAVDPEDVDYPVTVAAVCSCSYTETRYKGSKVKGKSWLEITGFEVTLKSFNGGRLKGDFKGVLAPLVGSSKNLTVKGKFSGPAIGG